MKLRNVLFHVPQVYKRWVSENFFSLAGCTPTFKTVAPPMGEPTPLRLGTGCVVFYPGHEVGRYETACHTGTSLDGVKSYRHFLPERYHTGMPQCAKYEKCGKLILRKIINMSYVIADVIF